MDGIEREVNKENFERFGSLQAYMQKAVQSFPDFHMIVSNGQEGFKDGLAYLFIPPAMKVPKALTLLIYQMVAEADETDFVAGETTRFCFIVNDVYTSGIPVPKVEDFIEVDENDDENIENMEGKI